MCTSKEKIRKTKQLYDKKGLTSDNKLQDEKKFKVYSTTAPVI